MAAAIIPLAISALPIAKEIISFIAGLVHPKVIAASQTATPLTGPLQFADVFVGTMNDLTHAKAAGTLAELPDEATVKIIIQSVYTALKLAGVLGQSGQSVISSPAPTKTSVVLHTGETITVSCS